MTANSNDVAQPDRAAFERILHTELDRLEAYNCARYRLLMGSKQAWIDGGRAAAAAGTAPPRSRQSKRTQAGGSERCTDQAPAACQSDPRFTSSY